MDDTRKNSLSGIQPSGDLHIGSYLGAIQNWASIQEEYNNFYCIVDMHAITSRQDPAELRERTLSQLAQYLACGLDPDKCALFIQSHVPAHAELNWILNCYTMFGELSRMTQFKDKSSKNSENINAGLFTYPVLMAADILLYQADVVPVGDDQKQHVEICRDIAIRFNATHGVAFKIPEPLISHTGARIMSLQNPTDKMSKSDDSAGSCVYLLDEPDAILKAFRRAVTDSDDSASPVRYDVAKKPGVSNLIEIYSSVTGKTHGDIEIEFAGLGYGAFKTAVGEAVVERLRPVRERAVDYLNNKDYLVGIYRAGAEKAAAVADKTVRDVYDKVGFVER